MTFWIFQIRLFSDFSSSIEHHLLHQHRLLAANIRHPHIGFADLDAEQGQRVEKQLVERLGKPGQRIGDRALDDGLRQADTETEDGDLDVGIGKQAGDRRGQRVPGRNILDGLGGNVLRSLMPAIELMPRTFSSNASRTWAVRTTAPVVPTAWRPVPSAARRLRASVSCRQCRGLRRSG